MQQQIEKLRTKEKQSFGVLFDDGFTRGAFCMCLFIFSVHLTGNTKLSSQIFRSHVVWSAKVVHQCALTIPGLTTNKQVRTGKFKNYCSTMGLKKGFCMRTYVYVFTYIYFYFFYFWYT